jgi:hypothetical protein
MNNFMSIYSMHSVFHHSTYQGVCLARPRSSWMMELKLPLELVSSVSEVHPFSKNTGENQRYIFLFMTDYVMYIFGRIPFHIFVQCPTPMIYNDKLYNFLYKYNTVYLYVLPLTFLLNCIPQTYSVCKIWSTLTIREPVTKI